MKFTIEFAGFNQWETCLIKTSLELEDWCEKYLSIREARKVMDWIPELGDFIEISLIKITRIE